MTPLIGFAPDRDPFTPGVITACDNMVPAMDGFKAAPSPQSIGVSALAATALGAAQVIKLDDSRRLFAGTSSALYEWSGSSWTDRSKGGGYSLGASEQWHFVQWGDVTIACGGIGETLQDSTTGAFADIAGAPKATCLDATQGFVMVGNYDAGSGAVADGWKCCALYDYTDWTDDVDTQAASGRLIETQGAIKAVKALGGDFVAYKNGSMFLGQFVGAPLIWQWRMVSNEIGAPGPGAVVPVDSLHIFMGAQDFYAFDGSRPVPIGSDIREWFFGSQLDPVYKGKVRSLHNKDAGIVYFFYPSRDQGSGNLDKWVAYNYRTQKWGAGSLNIECAVDWKSGGYTMNGLDSLASTMDALPQIPFDDPFWSSSRSVPAIINTSHVVQTLNGVSTGMSITTGDVGDDSTYSQLMFVRPRYSLKPMTAQATNFYRNDLDDTITSDVTVSSLDGKHDFLRVSRWHRMRLDVTGDCSVSAMYFKLQGMGDR